MVFAMAVAYGLYYGSTSESIIPVCIGTHIPPAKNNSQIIRNTSQFVSSKGIGIPSPIATNDAHVTNIIQFFEWNPPNFSPIMPLITAPEIGAEMQTKEKKITVVWYDTLLILTI